MLREQAGLEVERKQLGPGWAPRWVALAREIDRPAQLPLVELEASFPHLLELGRNPRESLCSPLCGGCDRPKIYSGIDVDNMSDQGFTAAILLTRCADPSACEVKILKHPSTDIVRDSLQVLGNPRYPDTPSGRDDSQSPTCIRPDVGNSDSTKIFLP